MATADSEIPSKGSVAEMINRLSRPDMAKVAPFAMKGPPPKPLLPTAEMSNSVVHVASFTYSAVQPDEIDLHAGDIIEYLEEVEDGWARGKNKSTGKSGLYPTNFVEEKRVLAVPKPSAATNTTVTATALKRISSGDEPQPQAIQRTPSINNGSSNRKDEFVEMAKVMFTYEAQHEDELSLPKVGAMVKIIKKDCGDPGWFMGELNAKRGLFPDNFVEIVKVPSTASPPLSKPGDKPPAKPPIGFNFPAVSVQAPPTVPAKPSKILTNSTNSTGNTPPPVTSKPMSNSFSNGGVADLKNQLLLKGFQARVPGEAPAHIAKPTPVDTKTDGSETDGTEQSDEVTQLVHLNKNGPYLMNKSRPRNPARRPMSMVALKRGKSQEDLLDGPTANQMSRSTVYSAAGGNKADLIPSPSRETTFPASVSPSPQISAIIFKEEKPIVKEEKVVIKEEPPKTAIVPPKSLSNSMHSISGLSTSQQSLFSAHAPVAHVTTSAVPVSSSSSHTSPNSAHSIGSIIRSVNPHTMSGDAGHKEEFIMVPRHEWESVLKRLDVLERRLVAVEKK